MRVLVLGIGSPFGQDRLGWLAVDGLMALGLAERFAPHELVLEKSDRPGTLLLERMRGFDCAILIDALVGGDKPGRVISLSEKEIESEQRLLSGHGLGVAETLALGRALGDLPGKVSVLGIEAGDEGLKAVVEDRTLVELVSLIDQAVSG